MSTFIHGCEIVFMPEQHTHLPVVVSFCYIVVFKEIMTDHLVFCLEAEARLQ